MDELGCTKTMYTAEFNGSEGDLIPTDFGDVCFNYDIDWFAERKITPPNSISQLTQE